MSNNIVILYVEDDQSVREEMLEILELEFDNIHAAKNGEEGLEMYKKLNPDIVVSDVNMPIMDGMTMSREIFSLKADAKILLITARDEDSFIAEMKELGIQECLHKPININDLFTTIDKMSFL